MHIEGQAERQELRLQRHDSAAHLLAEAMQELFPSAQFVNQHTNVEGFICEIVLAHLLVRADLAALEQRIAQLIARNWPCRRAYWSRSQALAYFRQHGQASQVAWLEQLPDENVLQHVYAADYPHLCSSSPDSGWPEDVLIFQHGNAVALCAGPHVEYAGEIGVCKLIRVEVVRGPEGLQRIYGSC